MAVTLAVPAKAMRGRHSFGDDQLDADREAPDRGPAQNQIAEMAVLLGNTRGSMILGSGNPVSRVSTLTIEDAGSLDLTDDDIIVDNTSLFTIAGYIAWKYVARQRFLRRIRIARITPEELKARLDAGDDTMIVDLRARIDFDADPLIIPGALHLMTEELEARHREIPRDREIVLYCT